MHKLYPLFVTLLPLAACTPRLAPAPVANSASYTLAGRTFVGVAATAYPRPAPPGGPEGLDILVGSRPIAPGGGAFLVSYYKAAGARKLAYKATLLTYTYNMAAIYYSVSYNEGLRCTLTRTRHGGYSGTFRGTFSGKGMAGGQRSTVSGVFTNVLPTPLPHP